jgi:CBS domain-containing protein
VFTERDILRRVVAAERDPSSTKVQEVMTTPVITCLPDTSVEECGAIMSGRRIRHLPVTDDRGLVGLVTSGDLLAFQVTEQIATIQFLNSYMFDVR